MAFHGVAIEAEIVAVDIGKDHNPAKWDFEKIAPGIRQAVKNGASLINVSGGTERPEDPNEMNEVSVQLERAVRYAYSKGCVVVAAVGNASKQPVAIPACLTDVVGVGAVGERDIAPEGTLMARYEEVSIEKKRLGRTPSGAGVFHLGDTSVGDGLDAVAPGIGIFVSNAAGVSKEWIGTSFASPIVVGVLACALSQDKRYAELSGAAKSDHAVNLLRRLCVDVGLPPAYQGWGLPFLKGDVIASP